MNLASIQQAFRARALQGLDPEDSPLSVYARCNRTAENHARVTRQAEDVFWHTSPVFTDEWVTTETVDRPTEDAALESWYQRTHPFRKAESNYQQSKRLAKEFQAIWRERTLKEIHAQRGVQLEWFDLNLPNAPRSNIIAMEVKKSYSRGKRWKDGEPVTP